MFDLDNIWTSYFEIKYLGQIHLIKVKVKFLQLNLTILEGMFHITFISSVFYVGNGYVNIEKLEKKIFDYFDKCGRDYLIRLKKRKGFMTKK